MSEDKARYETSGYDKNTSVDKDYNKIYFG